MKLRAMTFIRPAGGGSGRVSHLLCGVFFLPLLNSFVSVFLFCLFSMQLKAIVTILMNT